MTDLLREYLPILIFLGLATAMACVMIGASWLVGPKNPDPEKLSAYECGFDAFAVRADKSVEDALKGLAGMSVLYGRSAIEPRPLFRRRAEGSQG